ncbi:hypothetical protein DFQ27_008452 [Actinomortierella ambigua]|uniref:Uncharacterized protein n=1 Tax=Actinomortierella ambigua TaxID=1343610 RepID=A0A9P6UBC5_9FUNG|nr:hypothetical protein DFQ27_008452 [Actinomortierella ambigua]
MASVLAQRMLRMHTAVRTLGTAWSSRSGVSASASYRSHAVTQSWACPTSTLYSKQPFSSSYSYSSFSRDHPDTKTPPAGASATTTTTSSNDGDDDQMVGDEGIEAIDPKDYPELFPEHEGTSESIDAAVNPSVLLSDKERSEEEMSWFVDSSFADQPDMSASTAEEGGDNTAFVPLWQRNAERNREAAATEQAAAPTPPSGPMTVTGLVQLLETERAKHVHVIDMRDKCDWTNWMIICEGMSERHLGNLADHVYSSIKKHAPKSHPPVMEGRDTTDWIVIDADTVVIHFMTHEARKERDLEGLWASVTNPLKIKDASDLTWDDVKGKMTKSWKEDHGRAKGEDGKRGRRGDRDIPLSEVVRW